jgi:hypothetical protein
MAALGLRPATTASSEESDDRKSVSGSSAEQPPVPDPRLSLSPQPSPAEAERVRGVRIATDISAATLDLAKTAAYWNRETLRSFLERAIESEAGRVAAQQGLSSLPSAPPLRRGRPLGS